MVVTTGVTARCHLRLSLPSASPCTFPPRPPSRNSQHSRTDIPHNQWSPTCDRKCSGNSYCSPRYLCCSLSLAQRNLRELPGCQRRMKSSAPLCREKQREAGRSQGASRSNSGAIFHVPVPTWSTGSSRACSYKIEDQPYKEA